MNGDFYIWLVKLFAVLFLLDWDGKFVAWLKKRWAEVAIFPFLIPASLFLFVGILSIAPHLYELWSSKDFQWFEVWTFSKDSAESPNGKWDGYATRNLLIALGGIGALYGLVLAARRTEAMTKQAEAMTKQAEIAAEQVRVASEQVDIGTAQVKISQRQQFNETLRRGRESLSGMEISMRVSGMRLLEELYKDSDTPAQQRMIREMLLDFVRQHTQPTESR